MAKIVNFKLSGDDFFVMSISKIMVPLQSPGFLQYVDEFAIVLTTFVKRLLWGLEHDKILSHSEITAQRCILPVYFPADLLLP